MRNSFRTYARHLLHAFAEAGSVPPTHELQPLMGPWSPDVDTGRANSSGAAAYGQSPAYDGWLSRTDDESPRGRHPQARADGQRPRGAGSLTFPRERVLPRSAGVRHEVTAVRRLVIRYVIQSSYAGSEF
jgi:hypothetical protein